MKSHVVDCASCGAPLSGAVLTTTHALVPCLYCGALLRFTAPNQTTSQTPTVERHVAAEIIAKAREAALRGGRAEAIAVCVNEARVSEAAAAAAVDDMLEAVAYRVVFTQALNARGWLLILASFALLGGSVLLFRLDSASRWWGLLPLLLGLLNLSQLARGVAASVRHLVAQRGSARIVHAVHVGATGYSDGSQIYSLALDVSPRRGGTPFHARLVLPVRATSLAKVEAGKTLGVRYFENSDWLRAD